MRSVVDGVCSFAARGACTDAERRAALWLHDEVRSRLHEAWVETRWVRPRRAAVLALGCLLAVAGSLLSTAAAIAGLVAAAVGALSLVVEAAGRLGPIRALFPRRATQHVLTGVPDDGVVLMITAAYDAPQRGLVLNDRWRAQLRRAPPWTLAACGVAVAAAAVLRMAGEEPGWLGAVQLVPTVVLLVALAAALDVALSDWSPGANDNASGVGVAVRLLEELDREPPRALRPALLLTGAGHAVPRLAARALRAEGLGAERVVLLELGPCGAGRPAWAARHPQVRAAAQRAAAALQLAGGPPPRRPAVRVPAIRIACLDERGISPRAHQEDDTPERVDDAAMEAALDLALGVVDALDAQLSGSTPSAARSSTGSSNEHEP
jgi:hypothetical protein